MGLEWWLQLDHTRGSRPRCVKFMDGDLSCITKRDRRVITYDGYCPHIAKKLTDLIKLTGVEVTEDDFWMPTGVPRLHPSGVWDITPSEETRLVENRCFLSDEQRVARLRVSGYIAQ